MSVTVKLDTSKFQAQLLEIRKLVKKDIQVLIKEQSRLLVKDCLLLTPAFGPNPLSGETSGSQKRIQDRAIRRDVDKVFQPISKLRVIMDEGKFSKDLRRAVQIGDAGLVKKMLHGIGFNGFDVDLTATSERHAAARDSRGRVRKKTLATLIMRERTIAGYLRNVLTHAGKAKSGWIVAAQRLGVPISGWINRHSGAGLYQEKFGLFETSITVGNLVNYIQYKNRELRIMQIAVNRRANALKHRIGLILKARLKRERL